MSISATYISTNIQNNPTKNEINFNKLKNKRQTKS